MSSTRLNLEALATAEGLLLLGIVPLDHALASKRYLQWLADRNHADMKYLERNQEIRCGPEAILPGAKCACVFALPYNQPEMALESEPLTAAYARQPDYHRVLKKKLSRLWRSVQTTNGKFRVLVDSAPILERALAEQTELGFIGKNTCYIHPRWGSFLLLGEIVTTLDLALDTRHPGEIGIRTPLGGCGPCTSCQTSCPTGALDKNYQLDSRRCLAYWTIENRDAIPLEFWPHLARYWFGCDICQKVCPYNTHAVPLPRPADFPRVAVPDILSAACMDQSQYEAAFGGTPFTRAKRGGLRRNALIALVVTRHPGLTQAIEQAQRDPIYPLIETVAQISEFNESLSMNPI